MIVDEVDVRGVRFHRLKCVTNPARRRHRSRRVKLGGERGAERGAGAQVDPRAENASGRDRDQLVPGLGVDTARRAHRVVERHVVLHRPEIGQPGGHHVLPPPVLLEPAPVVAIHG